MARVEKAAEGRDTPPDATRDGESPMLKRIASTVKTVAILLIITGAAVVFRLSLALEAIR
jgi:hypothetical protein